MISKNLSLTAPPLSHPLSPPSPSAYSERLAESVHMAGNFGHNHQRNPSKGTHEKKMGQDQQSTTEIVGCRILRCVQYLFSG